MDKTGLSALSLFSSACRLIKAEIHLLSGALQAGDITFQVDDWLSRIHLKSLRGMKTILFICTGNFCRSPLAEGVMSQFCLYPVIVIGCDVIERCHWRFL